MTPTWRKPSLSMTFTKSGSCEELIACASQTKCVPEGVYSSRTWWDRGPSNPLRWSTPWCHWLSGFHYKFAMRVFISTGAEVSQLYILSDISLDTWWPIGSPRSWYVRPGGRRGIVPEVSHRSPNKRLKIVVLSLDIKPCSVRRTRADIKALQAWLLWIELIRILISADSTMLNCIGMA